MLCTYTVKCTLFSSYCTAMYCSPLWFCSTAASLQQLKVAYNNALRRLLGIPTYHSAREMFVNLGLPSFPELIRKHINLFVERLESSKNHIISKLVQSVVPLFSNIWKFWFKQTSGLYVWFYTILWSFHIVFIFYVCTGFINSLIFILYMDILLSEIKVYHHIIIIIKCCSQSVTVCACT